MSYNLNVLFPKPTIGTGSVQVAGQALTVSASPVQFQGTTPFNLYTTQVLVDVQGANVYCTFGGETPTAGTGHILYVGQNYTWSKAAAAAAQFVRTGSTNATLYASEFNE